MRTGWPILRVWLAHVVLLLVPLAVLTLFELWTAPGFAPSDRDWPILMAIGAIFVFGGSAAVTALQCMAGQRWSRLAGRPIATVVAWWRPLLWIAAPAWLLLLLVALYERLSRGIGSQLPMMGVIECAVGVMALAAAYIYSPLFAVPLLANATIKPDDAMRLGQATARWPGTCPECGTTLCEQRIALPAPLFGRSVIFVLVAGAIAVGVLAVAGVVIGPAAARVVEAGSVATTSFEATTSVAYSEVVQRSESDPVSAAIIQTAPKFGNGPVKDDAVLSVRFVGNGMTTWVRRSYGWPITVFAWSRIWSYSDKAMTIPEPLPAHGESLNLWSGSVHWMSAVDGIANTELQWSLDLSGLFTFMALAVLFVLAAIALDRVRRRAKATRRRFQGLCVVCAYPLRGAVKAAVGE